jgi:hypothetical protein
MQGVGFAEDDTPVRARLEERFDFF